MALLDPPPVRLQPYFGYRSRERLVLSARALRSGKPRFENRGRLQAMRTMLAQFASREEAGVRVTLEMDVAGIAMRHEAVTDREGFVRFDIALDPPFDLPPEPVWEVVALRWFNRDGPQCVDGHVLAPGTDSCLAVISDIDDTIIETGITGGMRAIARNWRRLLAELPDDRIAVPAPTCSTARSAAVRSCPPASCGPSAASRPRTARSSTSRRAHGTCSPISWHSSAPKACR